MGNGHTLMNSLVIVAGLSGLGVFCAVALKGLLTSRYLDGIPEGFEFGVLPDDWDQFQILMENALIRLPALVDQLLQPGLRSRPRPRRNRMLPTVSGPDLRVRPRASMPTSLASGL